MKAAIYARYSSDKQRAASITDQERNCKARIEKEGWIWTETFSDSAMSGAKRDRPSYQRMLAAARSKSFDVLVLDDLSRLSRDDIEYKTALKRLKFWGVRVIGITDGFDSSTENSKMVAGIHGVLNDLYLDDLGEKTHRGLKGNALNGQNTGGRAYGYDHVLKEHETERDAYGRPKILSVGREVDQEQAKIVRQIFEWFAEGRGYKEIASRLNERGIASLRGKRWGASTIRPMLGNETYRGVVIWNRREWVRDPDTDKRTYRFNSPDEWVRKEQPHLRIIDESLWRKVETRRRVLLQRHRDKQKTHGPNTRPGKSPKYLLSGILKCGVCGSDYIKANKTHYRCSSYINRGKEVCSNGISVRKDVAETAILHAIKTALFEEESFEDFKREARSALNERLKSRRKDASELRRQLSAKETEIANLLKLAKQGGALPTVLLKELNEAEHARDALQSKLDTDIPSIEHLEELFVDALNRYAAMAYHFEDYAARDVTKVRSIIAALVGGKITLHPTQRGGLEAQLQGHYDGLIELVKENPGTKAGVSKVRMVAGARFNLYRT